MFEVIVCPVKTLYKLALEGDMSEVAVVAVSSYDIDNNKLSGLYDVLTLGFDDVSSSDAIGAPDDASMYSIRDFVLNLPEFLDTLFVCCDCGVSRSPAIAAAIMRYLGRNDMVIWENPKYQPNTLVYQKLCAAFSINVSDGELLAKKLINSAAFDDAINSNRT